MNLVNRNTLQVKDLLPCEDGLLAYYTEYDMCYTQETNQLCRFPELLEIFNNGWMLETAPNWNFFRLVRSGDFSSKALTKDEIVSVLYKAFSDCTNIAVVKQGTSWEVTSKPMYKDETFEVYRSRAMFWLREYLEIPHYGLGKDSLQLKSPHHFGTGL